MYQPCSSSRIDLHEDTFLTSIPGVPSNTCTTARLPNPPSQPNTTTSLYLSYTPLASSTCPLLTSPSGNVKDTISLNRGNLTYYISQHRALQLHCVISSYIFENDQRAIDTSNGVVAHSWLDIDHHLWGKLPPTGADFEVRSMDSDSDTANQARREMGRLITWKEWSRLNVTLEKTSS
jgi:hypothetical protein